MTLIKVICQIILHFSKKFNLKKEKYKSIKINSYTFVRYPLFSKKNRCINALDSSAKMPETTVVFGCS